MPDDLRGIIGGLLLAGAGLIAARAWILRRFRPLGLRLGEMVEGRRFRPVRALGPGAFGQLTRDFNEQAQRLQDRLDRTEQDRRLLGAVLEGMAEGVIAVDPRRRLIFANRAAERLLGIPTGAVGPLVAELIRNPQVQGAIEATLAGPAEPHRVEISAQEPGAGRLGQTLALEVVGTPLPGTPAAGAVLVFHDVTSLRRLERMRQDFVANASHELKTPLASIKAYAETLLDGALHDDSVNERFVQQIDQQADRLHRLILDMLRLARLESGSDHFDHRPNRLMPLLERFVESHRGRADAGQIRLDLDRTGLDPETPVLAAEEALQQVVDNLIDNALKHTPAGGTVRIVARAAGSSVELQVADSGIGIPREHLSRVFERFYRVDPARSREQGGTGLGLSIVKHLVQTLGGSIGVESRPGQGSTFTVILPRYDAARA